MPDREISQKQAEAVHKWIREEMGGSKVTGLEAASVCGTAEAGVYRVSNEPLVIMVRARDGDTGRPENTVFELHCSEKHARALEVAGVVRFSLESQLGARTP